MANSRPPTGPRLIRPFPESQTFVCTVRSVNDYNLSSLVSSSIFLPTPYLALIQRILEIDITLVKGRRVISRPSPAGLAQGSKKVCSPRASRSWWRSRNGEKIIPKSDIFRQTFRKNPICRNPKESCESYGHEMPYFVHRCPYSSSVAVGSRVNGSNRHGVTLIPPYRFAVALGQCPFFGLGP